MARPKLPAFLKRGAFVWVRQGPNEVAHAEFLGTLAPRPLVRQRAVVRFYRKKHLSVVFVDTIFQSNHGVTG